MDEVAAHPSMPPGLPILIGRSCTGRARTSFLRAGRVPSQLPIRYIYGMRQQKFGTQSRFPDTLSCCNGFLTPGAYFSQYVYVRPLAGRASNATCDALIEPGEQHLQVPTSPPLGGPPHPRFFVFL